MDELNILLAASIDEKKSVSNIASQINKIEKQLSNINISLDLSDIQTSFKNMIQEVSKNTSKIKIYDSKDTKVEIDKTINDFSKLKTEIEKKLNSLPNRNVGTSTTNDMFAMVNTADSYKDLKAVKQLADEYYTDCINNEKEYQAQKKIINDGTKDTFKQESSNIDYIYSKKKQLLELERQIDNAVINKGVNKDDFDISSIKSELDRLASSKTEILNDEKNKVNEIINNLKLQLKVEKDIIDVKDKQENAYRNIEKQLSKLNNVTENNSKYNSNTYSKLTTDLEKLKHAVENGDISFSEFTNEIKKSEVAISSFDQETRKLSSSTDILGDSLKRAFAMFTMYDALQIGKRAISGMVSDVKDLDSAMISLRRVTSETDSTYQSFLNNLSDTAMNIGAQIPDMVDSVTSFSKLGYSFAESQKLATDATKYATAGEMQLATATDALSASYAVFKNEVKDTTEIIDLYNHIGNTMAITSEGIGNAMKVSANSLSIANNSISESVSMIAAANRTVLDPEKIGAGLRVISMRLRGISEESGQLIPKMREDVLSLTNGMVDIWDEANNEFKSTYDNLLAIGEVYDTLDDKKAANLLEKIAGKNRAEIAAAIITNTEDMKKGLEEAGNAAGSVDMEVEASMNSIEKKTEQVGIAFSKLASETISGDFVKSVLDSTVNITEMVTKMGGLTPIVSGLGVAFAALKFNSMVGGIKSVSDVTSGMSLIMNGATASVTALSLAMNLFIGGAIIAGVVGVTKVLDIMVTTVEEQSIKVGELKDKYNELNEEIEILKGLSNPTEADTTILKYKELELEATRLLVEENEKLLVQKEMFGKGVWGQGDILGIEQTISDAKQLQSAIENVKLDISNMKSMNANGEYDSSIEMQEEHLVNLYSQQVGVVPSLTQAYDKLTESRKYADDKQKEQIDTSLNAIDTIISESDAITNLGTAANQASSDVNGLSESMNGVTNPKLDTSSFTDLTSQFEEAIGVTDILEQAMSELTTTNTLSESSIKALSKAYPELLNAMGSHASLSNALSNLSLEEDISKTEESVKQLNQAINSLNDGQTLTGDTIVKLMDTYPQLRSQITETNGVYSISIKALEELRDMTIEEQKVAIQANANKSLDLKAQTEFRLDCYRRELEALKTLAQAQAQYAMSRSTSVLDRAKKGVSSMSSNQKKIDELNKLIVQEENLSKEYQANADRANKIMQGFDISTSTGNTKKGSNISNKKDKKSKEISDYFDAAIKTIQSERTKLDHEISKTSAEIELFTLKGLDTTELSNKMTLLLSKQREITEAENVSYRALQGQIAAKIKATSKEEDRIKLQEEHAKLEELIQSNSVKWWGDKKEQLTQELDLIQEISNKTREAYDGDLSDNESQQKNLSTTSLKYRELELKNIESLRQKYTSYLKEIESLKAKGFTDESNEIKELEKEYKALNTEITEREVKVIELKYEANISDLDDKIRQLELDQMLMNESSDAYMDVEDMKLKYTIQKQQEINDAVNALREQGYEDEDSRIQALKDSWYDYEKTIRNVYKSTGEARKKSLIDSVNKELDSLKEAQTSIQSLVDMTMKMLKQKYEDEKEAIQETIDLKEESIRIEIDGYKKIYDEKKKALRDEVNERDYNKGLKEKEKKISDTEKKILALSKDNSKMAEAERRKLEEELAKLKEELTDYQYDYSIEKKEEQLDEEMKRFEEAKNAELEKYKKEKEEELKKLQEHLDKEGNLREEALELIKNKNKDFYEQLLKWNSEYGSGVDEEVTNAWGEAYDAMKQFGDGSNNVYDTLGDIVDKMKELNEELREANSSGWQDHVEGEENRPNRPSDSGGGNSNKPSNNDDKEEKGKERDEAIKQMIRNSANWFNEDSSGKKRLEKENEQLAKKIGAWKSGNNGKWYVKISGTDYQIENAIGRRHTGAKTGIVGDRNNKINQDFLKLASDEELNILQYGESVLTSKQMTNTMKLITGLANNQGNGDITIKIDKLIDVDRLDNNVDIESITKRAIDAMYKAMADGRRSMGIRGSVR